MVLEVKIDPIPVKFIVEYLSISDRFDVDCV